VKQWKSLHRTDRGTDWGSLFGKCLGSFFFFLQLSIYLSFDPVTLQATTYPREFKTCLPNNAHAYVLSLSLPLSLPLSLYDCRSMGRCLTSYNCPKLQTKISQLSQVWWCTAAIPALRRLRQENCLFKSSLLYLVRLWLKNKLFMVIAVGVYQYG
jgi:hypothetical protein